MSTGLRSLLARGRLVVAPGAYDPISARLIEQTGFPAVYVGGYATSGAYLLQPDLGLLSFTEMLDQATRCAAATSLPVIADVDTGFGGVLNVQRTVRAYERAGIAAIHIEDQVMPKRCGHVAGKQVIPAEQMAEKVAAAVDARASDELLIIARTDARQVYGLADAIARGRLYRAAGADMLFVDAPESAEEIATIARELGPPLLFNASPTGKAPLPAEADLEAMGYSLVIYPLQLLGVAFSALQWALETLKADRSSDAVLARSATFAQLNRFFGMDAALESARRFERAAQLS